MAGSTEGSWAGAQSDRPGLSGADRRWPRQLATARRRRLTGPGRSRSQPPLRRCPAGGGTVVPWFKRFMSRLKVLRASCAWWSIGGIIVFSFLRVIRPLTACAFPRGLSRPGGRSNPAPQGGRPRRRLSPGAAPLPAVEAPLGALETALAGQFGQDDRRARRTHRHWGRRRRRAGGGSGFPPGEHEVWPGRMDNLTGFGGGIKQVHDDGLSPLFDIFS